MSKNAKIGLGIAIAVVAAVAIAAIVWHEQIPAFLKAASYWIADALVFSLFGGLIMAAALRGVFGIGRGYNISFFGGFFLIFLACSGIIFVIFSLYSFSAAI